MINHKNYSPKNVMKIYSSQTKIPMMSFIRHKVFEQLTALYSYNYCVGKNRVFHVRLNFGLFTKSWDGMYCAKFLNWMLSIKVRGNQNQTINTVYSINIGTRKQLYHQMYELYTYIIH